MNGSHLPPARPQGEPRHEVPKPREPGIKDEDFQGRVHPSDYHADCAFGALNRAIHMEDTLKQQNELMQAQAFATLSLRDAVLEASATYKELTTQAIETNAELSDTLKKVGRHVIGELRKATVKAA